MKITVNGKETTINQSTSITKLLQKGYTGMLEYITVQVNDDILSKDVYDTYPIKNGDVIEFLFYMGGGSKLS